MLTICSERPACCIKSALASVTTSPPKAGLPSRFVTFKAYNSKNCSLSSIAFTPHFKAKLRGNTSFTCFMFRYSLIFSISFAWAIPTVEPGDNWPLYWLICNNANNGCCLANSSMLWLASVSFLSWPSSANKESASLTFASAASAIFSTLSVATESAEASLLRIVANTLSAATNCW